MFDKEVLPKKLQFLKARALAGSRFYIFEFIIWSEFYLN